MTPITEQQWNTAAALALECAFAWGDWALRSSARPVPVPETLEQAQADWAASGGDPAYGPTLSWRSEDRLVSWVVDGDTYTRIRVGPIAIVMHARGWYVDREVSKEWSGDVTPTCLTRLARLVEVANAARRGR
jgi:hypothetical protein